MKSFRRIFKYVWPQWPRIIVVVVSAIVVAVLLSLSFMTVIPLLKVMIGEEGLHGWVDRKSCNWRYGINFYVPDTADLMAGDNGDIRYYLLITGVHKKSLAQAAGLKSGDRIFGVGENVGDASDQRIVASKLLEELAAADTNEISVQLHRLDQDGHYQPQQLQLMTEGSEAMMDDLQWGAARRFRWNVKRGVIERAQWAADLLPRTQARENKTKAVVYIILVMVVVTIVRCIAKFYQGYLAQKVVQTGLTRLREDAFAHVMEMPMSYFADERPSDAVSRIIRDTAVLGKAVKIMLGKALREPLNAIFMLSFAMLLNWQLALIFLCSAPAVVALLAVFGGRMKRATGKSLIAGSQMLAKLQETMSALKVVKVYNQQDNERATFARINRSYLKQLLKISKVDAATSPVMEVLGMLAGSAALIIGAHWVTQNRMDGSEFLALLILLGAAAEAIRKTGDIWNKIQEANAAAERVFAIMDEPVEFEQTQAIEVPPLRNKIEFKDVYFTYPKTERSVLKGVNLTVKAGHNIAIVGPNGSGKTTLVNLLPRFYNIDSGLILIDGQGLNQCSLESLRDQIGMVTQNVVTFNDTIAANIAYARPEASEEEIIAAAKRSFAHEFIEPLPDGYQTMIGEQGAGLSGGQLQRIVIARAILKNPPILIFDEATSQIDADSEAKIHKAIEEFMQDRTSFIIAHRFSTVVNADVIVVMDDGQIIAQGQHNQLIDECSLYQSLYETQLIASK